MVKVDKKVWIILIIVGVIMMGTMMNGKKESVVNNQGEGLLAFMDRLCSSYPSQPVYNCGTRSDGSAVYCIDTGVTCETSFGSGVCNQVDTCEGEQSCTDSDGTDRYNEGYVEGINAQGTGYKIWDYCISDTQVSEQICGDLNPTSITLACVNQYECYSGECIEASCTVEWLGNPFCHQSSPDSWRVLRERRNADCSTSNVITDDCPIGGSCSAGECTDCDCTYQSICLYNGERVCHDSNAIRGVCNNNIINWNQPCEDGSICVALAHGIEETACIPINGCPGAVTDNGLCEVGLGDSCEQDIQCPPESICTGNPKVCTEVECIRTSDCPEDNNPCTQAVCVNGINCDNAAISDGTICTITEGTGTCQLGECVIPPSGTGCTSDSECDPGETCVNGNCVGTTQSCTDLGGIVYTQTCEALNMTRVLNADGLAPGEDCCKEAGSADECLGGLQTWDAVKGECEWNSWIMMAGLFLLLIVGFKTIAGVNKK